MIEKVVWWKSLVSGIIAVVAIILWYLTRARDDLNQICITDCENFGNPICRPSCPHGQFSLPGMTSCHPWLKCDDMNSSTDFQLIEELGHGAVKTVGSFNFLIVHSYINCVNILQIALLHVRWNNFIYLLDV